MSIIHSLMRRLKQLDKLIAPPPHLRREHERYTIDLPVRVSAADGTGEAGHIAIDISDGGMFIEPAYPSATGRRIKVSVGSLIRNADAVIVAHRGHGTAIRFESPAHGAMLRAWLTEMRRNRVN